MGTVREGEGRAKGPTTCHGLLTLWDKSGALTLRILHATYTTYPTQDSTVRQSDYTRENVAESAEREGMNRTQSLFKEPQHQPTGETHLYGRQHGSLPMQEEDQWPHDDEGSPVDDDEEPQDSNGFQRSAAQETSEVSSTTSRENSSRSTRVAETSPLLSSLLSQSTPKATPSESRSHSKKSWASPGASRESSAASFSPGRSGATTRQESSSPAGFSSPANKTATSKRTPSTALSELIPTTVPHSTTDQLTAPTSANPGFGGEHGFSAPPTEALSSTQRSELQQHPSHQATPLLKKKRVSPRRQASMAPSRTDRTSTVKSKDESAKTTAFGSQSRRSRGR